MSSHAAERHSATRILALGAIFAVGVWYALDQALDDVTGCFRCGNPDGSAVRLCASCIAEKVAGVPWM